MTAPVVETGVGDVAAVAVLATRPAPALGTVDQRLLARFVENIDRRLLRSHRGEVRDLVMDRLCRLVAVVADVPVGDGIALVAGTGGGTLLHLRAPVRDRACTTTTPPTDVDLGLRAWPGDPVAILVLDDRRARLLVLRRGLLQERVDTTFPIRRSPQVLLPDHLARIGAAVADAAPDVPIVVGGVERLARAFRDRSTLGERIIGVLPGEQASASPASLLALVRSLPERLTPLQRRAIAEVAIGELHGRVVAGPHAVERALPAVADPHVVVEAGVLDDDLTGCAGTVAEAALLEALGGRGRVTIVPSGRLPGYDGIVLVHDEAMGVAR